MLRATCLSLTLLLLPRTPMSADTPADLGANAALKYWQAFALLPPLTKAERDRLVAECVTMPLDARARELVSRADYSLKMLHRGAALPHCDWGIGWEEGVDVRLPQATAARVLASLACLRVRLRFEADQSGKALDDAVAALTLGRQVSSDTINILLLTGYAIEHRMTDTLALYLPRLDARTIQTLKKRLDALPSGGTPTTALKFEEQFALTWFVGKVKERNDRERLLDFLGPLCAEKGDSPEKRRERGRTFLRECGGTAAGVLRFAQQTHQSYARLARKLDLPLDSFGREYEAEVKKQAGNPVFNLLFPALHRVRLQQLRADVRRALLFAALAVQVDGKEALKTRPDPVVGGAFEYRAFKGGFELRSKWKVDDKLRAKWKLDERVTQPLTLTVGRRGQ